MKPSLQDPPETADHMAATTHTDNPDLPPLQAVDVHMIHTTDGIQPGKDLLPPYCCLPLLPIIAHVMKRMTLRLEMIMITLLKEEQDAKMPMLTVMMMNLNMQILMITYLK